MAVNASPPWRGPSEAELVPYQPWLPEPGASLLVLAPHPDDEVFGCGGLLALAAAARLRSAVVIVSDGAVGGDAPTRAAESRAAARELGYAADGNPQFWQQPDRGVDPGADLVGRIQLAIEACAANWVLAPSPFEIHPDHRAVCRAAITAAQRQRQGTRLVFYEVGQPLVPNRLVDITSVMPQKLRAMACFGSQLSAQRYDEQVAALNRYRAYTLGPLVTHAEALWVVSDQDLTGGTLGVLDGVQRELMRRLNVGPG